MGGQLQLLRQEMASLHWTEKMEVVNLTAMLAILPINSGVSLVFACCWFLAVALKNSLLKRWSFFNWHEDKSYKYEKSAYVLIPMMCYFLAYLVSMLWTENRTVGWVEVGQIAWFFLIPMACLCTDFRQISKRMVRAMLWLFVLSMTLLFWYLLVKAVIGICQSSTHSLMSGLIVFPEFMHHGYSALYVMAGLTFLYTELIQKEKLSGILRALLVFCASCLVLFLFFVNSRAGILCLIMLALVCGLHICLIQRKLRQGVMAIVAILALVTVVHFALPEQYRRLSKTTTEIAEGETSDARFRIMESAWEVVKEHPLLGVGAGDRMESLVPYYGTLDDVYCPHNQFLDAWLATGVFGMLILWVMLLLPMVVAWLKHQFFPFMVNLILLVNLLVESMFERQMGVVFAAVIYVYYVLLFQQDSQAKMKVDKDMDLE
jgi:O-antigen ligase